MKRFLMTAIAALALSTPALAEPYPTTNLFVGPDQKVWVGQSPLDRNDPNYEINKKNGSQDYPFNISGSHNIRYTPILGNNHPAGSAVLGADNAVWFTLDANSQGFSTIEATIGRATADGVTNLYPVRSDTSSYITALAAGPDGNIWYSLSGGIIGKMSTSGETTEYKIGYTATPGGKGIAGVVHGQTPMIFGPDGKIWLAQGSQVISFDTATQKTSAVQLPNAPGTQLPIGVISLAAGPDGNIWYIGGTNLTNPTVSIVGKIPVSGAKAGVTAWTVVGDAGAITAGPDGNVWFTSVEVTTEVRDIGGYYRIFNGKIVRIDTNGNMTEYPLFKTDKSAPWTDVTMSSLVTGADGKLYASRYSVNVNTTYSFVENEVGGYTFTPDAPTNSADPTVTVLTTGNGSGSVKMSIGKNPGNNQQLITLTAVTGNKSQFDGWSDPTCQKKSTCQFVLSGNKTVTAAFNVPHEVQTTMYQGAVFATNTRKSYIRLYATQNGIVTVNLIDPRSGEILGTSEESVPAGGEKQVAIDALVPSIPPDGGLPSYYTVSVQASNNFNGYYQHVLWDPTAGVITNLTACETPLNNVGQVGYVYSSIYQEYPSMIVVTNPTDKELASVALDISDENGTQLGTYQSDVVPAKSSKILQIAEVESRSGIRPQEAAFNMFVIKPKADFKGSIQHLIVNKAAGGILSDMTTVCPLTAAAN